MSFPKQKTALVTGCSEIDHLGPCMALELNRRGWRVYATTRRAGESETSRKLRAEGCEVLHMDVVDDEAIRGARIRIEKEAQRLDLIINNAAMLAIAPLIDTDVKLAAKAFDINTLGPLRIIQQFSKLMLDTRAKSGRDSQVVNIGSVSRWGGPMSGAYSISKASLGCLNDVMRLELENLGIKFTYVELSGMKYNTADPPNVRAETPSGVYSNSDQVVGALADAMKEYQKSAPEPKTVAASIVQQVDSSKYPKRVYAGGSAGLLPYVPLLPFWMIDRMWRQFSKSDLLKG